MLLNFKMPLLQANPANKYEVTFWTLSGFNETPPDSFRTKILDTFKQEFPNWKDVVVAYEVSNTGFKHYHVGLELHYRSRWSKSAKAIRTMMSKQMFCEPQALQVNVSVVPLGGERGQDGVHRAGMVLVRSYLMNPTKEKEVDGRIVIEKEDDAVWNVYRYIATLDDASCKKKAIKIADWYKKYAPPEAGPLSFRLFQSLSFRMLAAQTWFESEFCWD